jgi:hypothetical protein
MVQDLNQALKLLQLLIIWKEVKGAKRKRVAKVQANLEQGERNQILVARLAGGLSLDQCHPLSKMFPPARLGGGSQDLLLLKHGPMLA